MEALTTPKMSPLRLDKYFLKKLHFELYEGYDKARVPDSDLTVPVLSVEVVSTDQNPENLLQWRFELNIELLEPEDGEFPYKVETIVVGYFTVSSTYPSENAENLARVNGPSLLYSTARELIALVTGRSQYSALLIPVASFFGSPQSEEVKVASKQLSAGIPKQAQTRRAATKKVSKKRASKKKSG
jgi:preprotein translocase subunit SecB